MVHLSTDSFLYCSLCYCMSHFCCVASAGTLPLQPRLTSRSPYCQLTLQFLPRSFSDTFSEAQLLPVQHPTCVRHVSPFEFKNSRIHFSLPCITPSPLFTAPPSLPPRNSPRLPLVLLSRFSGPCCTATSLTQTPSTPFTFRAQLLTPSYSPFPLTPPLCHGRAAVPTLAGVYRVTGIRV